MVLVVTVVGTAGCRRTPPRIQVSDVERCEAGIERAMQQPTVEQGSRVYYEECSAVYAEPACRAAFVRAASVAPEDRVQTVAEPCRKAYCPILEERNQLEACQGDFQPDKGNLERTWPNLHNAILKQDARGLAPRLTRMMLGFYTWAKAWPSPSSAPSGTPAASGSADTASSAKSP